MHADGIAIPSERVGQCRATKYNSDDKLERVYHRFFYAYFFSFHFYTFFYIVFCSGEVPVTLSFAQGKCLLLLGSNMLNIALCSSLCALCSSVLWGEKLLCGRNIALGR
jgi:hypothetical protein